MRRHLKNLIKIIAITIFVLYCLIWLLSPVIANYVINNHGLPKGYSIVSSSSIRYNPFMAHLSISDLELQLKEKGTVLKLENLNAEIHLYQLLFDTIYIAEFEVDGVYIPVVAKNTSLTVAGFELMNGEAESDSEQVVENENSESPYKLVIPNFDLNNAIVELEHLDKNHHIQLNSLSIEDILLSQKEQDLQLLLMSKINDAPIRLEVNAKLIEQQGLVDVALNVDEFSLNHVQGFMPETLKALNGELSYSNKLSVKLSSDSTMINVDSFLLSINDFHVEQGNFSVDIASQQVHSDDLLVTLVAETPANIAASIVSKTNGVLVKTIADNEQLVKIEDIAVEGVSLTFAEDIPSVAINTLNVSDGVFSQHSMNDLPALASFKQLAINDIGYKPDSVSIQDITLSGLVSNLLLDENKKLATLISLNETQASTADNQAVVDEKGSEEESTLDNTEVKESDGSEFTFSLGEFKLLDDAVIDFEDKSVKPHYQRNVQINTLSLKDINTAKPALESLFNLQGKSDKYANFVVSGRGQPFAEKQSFNMDAVIKEVSLPSVSSYIKNALKYEIESGQLDVKIKAGLDGSEINGDVDLLLRGVEFTAADDHESGTVTDQTSVPFNVALGMLKDSDGNVELSVPLSGDTSSPSFGFSGFITLLVKQATMSAAKEYLITTFVPYASVMKVAMAAGEYALKLRINDLNYLPKQVELSAEQLEFSRQMSVMLEDQSDINVKLCAIATPADIAVTSAEEAHLPDNVERLKAISQQRVELFKDYMVEKLNVTSAKLLLCTPQIDTSKEAKSRIEFVI